MIEKTGIPTTNDIKSVIPAESRLNQGPVAIFECFQQIPCNPCADACPRGAIKVPDINDRPILDENLCNGCGVCLTHCPGLSIVVVDVAYSNDQALLKIPFEFSPLPTKDEIVQALDRTGNVIGNARVIRAQHSPNKTSVLWLAVPKDLVMQIRNIRRREED